MQPVFHLSSPVCVPLCPTPSPPSRSSSPRHPPLPDPLGAALRTHSATAVPPTLPPWDSPSPPVLSSLHGPTRRPCPGLLQEGTAVSTCLWPQAHPDRVTGRRTPGAPLRPSSAHPAWAEAAGRSLPAPAGGHADTAHPRLSEGFRVALQQGPVGPRPRGHPSSLRSPSCSLVGSLCSTPLFSHCSPLASTRERTHTFLRMTYFTQNYDLHFHPFSCK